jgi:hypothetical protein
MSISPFRLVTTGKFGRRTSGYSWVMGIDQIREDNELDAVRRELDRFVANRAMTGLTASQRDEYLALCAHERSLLEGRLGVRAKVSVGANA